MMRLRPLSIFAALAAGLALSAAPARAADLLPAPVLAAPAPVAAPWAFDVAVGAKLLSDYNFRGISQSDRGPAVQAYAEARYGWLYAGVFASSVKLPTDPTVELDGYFGIKPVWGPVTFDFGATYYGYPKERQLFVAGLPFSVKDTDYFEPFAKVSYNWNDTVTVGANLFYTPDWLGSGATGTYLSGTAKVTLPQGFAVSGELGHYWLGRTGATLGFVQLPDYTYWNVGLSYTLKDTITFDVRYHDTNLSRAECFVASGDPRGITNGGRSRWCSPTVIAGVSFDTTLSAVGALPK